MILRFKLIFQLAFRNLIRNRIRTILNLTMVVGAFSSIIIFRGFSNYMIDSFQEIIVKGPSGHLQMAKAPVWAGDLPKHKEDAYIENAKELEARLRELPQVLQASGRADAYVLLSNGDQSVGAMAIGFDPTLATTVEKAMTISEGTGFGPGAQFEILVGAGLQKQLHLKVGQTLTVVSQTLAGSASSLDPEVRGVVQTGLAELDNSLVYMPLVAMQKLLGTDRVEKIAVVLKDDVPLGAALDVVKENLHDRPELVVKDWMMTSPLHQQLVDFYGAQNIVIAVILSTLVFFGILNTVGMSIFERTGEIGTLRALGDQEGQVMTLLLFEGLILGLLGAVLGVCFSSVLAAAISTIGYEVLLPGASQPMLILIKPHLNDYVEATGVVATTCLISSFWPAFKAVRLSIVDALRANS